MNSIELAKQIIIDSKSYMPYNGPRPSLENTPHALIIHNNNSPIKIIPNDDTTQLATDFLELVELCKDVMHQIHTQKGCWPAEVDSIDDFLDKLNET